MMFHKAYLTYTKTPLYITLYGGNYEIVTCKHTVFFKYYNRGNSLTRKLKFSRMSDFISGCNQFTDFKHNVIELFLKPSYNSRYKYLCADMYPSIYKKINIVLLPKTIKRGNIIIILTVMLLYMSIINS